jgi:1-acyl-sn-glycerol-3-phosphate acyltransferase
MNLDHPAILVLLVLAIAAAVGGFVILPWLKRGPRGEVIVGLLWRLLRLYVKVVHHVRFDGLEKIRNQPVAGPLIVVSNHTGAVDPLLIQAGCRFHIRWMMASDMMMPVLDWFWKRERLIPVARDGRDAAALREALRHVQNRGAIGIFPEGRIVRPPHEIRPFHPGIGFIIARTQAPVMLVWVTGTPDAPDMAGSILTPSRARVHFLEVIDYKDQRDPVAITQDLRQRLAKATGWPLNDEPMPART